MAEVLVSGAGLVAIAVLAWFFFGPRKAGGAELRDGHQEIEIMVKGGYSPNLIRVRQGVPLRLVFDRQEAGECTARVVFPDFGVNRALAPFASTTVEFTPRRSGEFGFACGMNMVHGTLLVEPNGDAAAGNGAAKAGGVDTADRNGGGEEQPAAAGGIGAGADTEAAARREEIADLTRRVALGAVLTAPVLFAMMASEVFGASWVPGFLLDHWVQLAVIAPSSSSR